MRDGVEVCRLAAGRLASAIRRFRHAVADAGRGQDVDGLGGVHRVVDHDAGWGRGAHASYTVRLATQPSTTVTVVVTGHSGTDLSLDTTSLTFTTATWNTAQTVMLTAEDDEAASDAATLVHTASDGDYGSVTADLA